LLIREKSKDLSDDRLNLGPGGRQRRAAPRRPVSAKLPLADEEEFIEMIPFSETRNHVKNMLRNCLLSFSLCP